MKLIRGTGNTNIISFEKNEYEFLAKLVNKYKLSWSKEEKQSGILTISNSYVGYISNGETQINLKSKYPQVSFSHIIRMYLYTYGFYDDKASELMSITNVDVDVDIARLFLEKLNEQIHIGIYTTYKKEHDTTYSLAGNVNLIETYKNFLVNKTPHVRTEKFNLTTDNWINRLLVGALLKIQNDITHKSSAIKLFDYFSSNIIPVLSDAREYLNKFSFDNNNIRYKEVLELACMVIDNSDFSDFGSDTGIKSFIINFDLLFENFVIKILESIPRKSLFTTWKRSRPLTVFSSPYEKTYKPDILYKFEEESAIYNYKMGAEAVLDTKNKANNLFTNSDIYQILTYANALQSNKAILIYPSFNEKKNLYLDVDNELFNPNRVYGCFINIVEDTGTRFEQSILNFVSNLNKILK